MTEDISEKMSSCYTSLGYDASSAEVGDGSKRGDEHRGHYDSECVAGRKVLKQNGRD